MSWISRRWASLPATRRARLLGGARRALGALSEQSTWAGMQGTSIAATIAAPRYATLTLIACGLCTVMRWWLPEAGAAADAAVSGDLIEAPPGASQPDDLAQELTR